ncbi:type II secretion system F family protein [Arsenicicoccus piscis]|uniref:Type II secretion system protein GspF domain-containing protein n=1 Tax=Arsenicicoccus piscis TaxID=673954 RepID=A0ABQ6HIR4_9MICO|nr:type II secretion system F family protein [Arsenicicoccus piscis]MCH8627595.1 type II secretion system F family protein [Arsenicicoccus piscis]GMA18080.1 hypothetical protein GCM10025862_01010 [Arsenicicoccus piscis]GMA21949.1 hypothetical protein GCM10025862_39700 [Arsenicicoccus piscis]
MTAPSGAWLAAILVGVATLLWTRPGAALPVRPGAGATGSRPGRRGSTRARRHRPSGLTRADLAHVAELLAACLRSGAGVVESVEAVATAADGEVAGRLRAVAAALRWGIPPLTAWRAAGGGLDQVGRPLVLAEETGLAPADLLVSAAQELRQAEAHDARLRATRLEVSATLPMGLAFLPGFALTAILPLVVALAGSLG